MKLLVFQIYGLIERVLKKLRNQQILLDILEKDLFEKFHNILGHIIILKNFGNNKHYLDILKLDLFVKFITFWVIV